MVLTAVLATLLFPDGASAHALVGRQDLPIPEWLFAWGASIVLIVSFVGLTLLWREPRLERDGWRPVSERLSGILINRVTEFLAGAIGVGLLIVVVWSGLEGTEAPDRNFSVTFVFVTFWLGLVLLSVLFGDVFRAFNPWRAIARAAGAGFRAIAGQSAPAPLSYPEKLGRWPAVVGLVAFLWLELIWGRSGFATAGLLPSDLALGVLIYSAITFIGMTLFGVEKWTSRGETFSVYYGMFARLSVLEVRDGRLGVRRFLSGAVGWAALPGSIALLMVAIGGTAFDGAQEGALREPINSVFDWFRDDIGLAPTDALRLTGSLFMAATIAVVAGIFWAGIRGMRTVDRKLSTRELGFQFGHAFIAIALAYLVAHYFSLFVFQEQAQFTFLLSDPLGDGSNYFGTASTGIDYALIGATPIWYVQVGALVIGHVFALISGHDKAVALYGDSRIAARSQYWMLAMMVAFTTLGLYLPSQANQ
ncbi:MAG: fenitrothion hydrolase [Solirubrobacterales bacterium]